MSDTEKIISRAAFCEAQIAAWSKRAEHLRVLLTKIDAAACAHHKRAVVLCPACVTLCTEESATVTTNVIDDDTIEAMQRAIALCEVEAEHWRARSRGAAT